MAETLHCTYCGVPHTVEGWPKQCGSCSRITYRNPTPVAVCLQPVSDPAGLIAIRRGIEPRMGQVALPGGYVDWKETWQEGCAREVKEETQLEIDPAGIELFDVHSADTTILIFGLARPLDRASLPAFQPSNETSERPIVEGPIDMAFPLHTQMVAKYFAERT